VRIRAAAQSISHAIYRGNEHFCIMLPLRLNAVPLVGQLTDFCNVRSGLAALRFFFFFFDREKKKKKKREGGGQREIRYHRDLRLIKEIFVIKGHIYMSAIDITDKEEYQSWATLSSTVSCCSSA
jgi:hypothetical protein